MEMEAAESTEFIDVDEYNLNLGIISSLRSMEVSNFLNDQLQVLDCTAQTFLKTPKQTHANTEEGQSSNFKPGPEFVCEICVEPKSCKDSFSIKGCKHSYCNDCMIKYVGSKLQENISNIGCPISSCVGVLEPEYCRAILPQEVFDRWGKALCEAVFIGSEKFYCPFKDCSAMMIDDGDKDIKESECPNCRRLFCAQCKTPWHSEVNCEEFQKLHKDEREREDIMLKKLGEKSRWRRCPKCKIYVERTEGCGYMFCWCKCAFCYFCGFINNTKSHMCPSCKKTW